jgi:hypothetical protein
MSRLSTAFRAFFGSLSSQTTASRVAAALANQATPTVAPALLPAAPSPAAAPAPQRPAQSEAITLLATLQREARFVDFLKEDLAGFDDAQIGAVAREIHRDCGLVLDRLFAIAPIAPVADGEQISELSQLDQTQYQLAGRGLGTATTGTVRHVGWQATKQEVPIWSGKLSAARIICPAEVEVR